MKVQVENLKCGGCVNSITNALQEIKGVSSVVVDKDNSEVTIEGDFEAHIIVEKLDHLGYPVSGHNSIVKKAKSYVSCAIGRM